MLADELLQGSNIVLVLHRLQAHGLLVDPLVEIPVLVQNVGHAAGHAGREVLAGLAQDHDSAAGHVLTAVVTHALDNGSRAAVADAEALTGHAGDEGLAAGGTVKGHIAGDDVFLGLVADALGRADDDLAAGQALAHVVVAVAGQAEGQALGDERAKALAACADALGGVDIVGQGAAVLAGDLAAKDGTQGAVGVGDLQPDALGCLAAQLELLHQHLHVEGVLKVEVIGVGRHKVDVAVCNGRVVQDAVQIHLGGTAAGSAGLDMEQVGAAHQLVDGAHAKLGHVLPQLLRHKGQVVDDILGLALEPLAQLGVLGADAHGAGVQVADTHHHAAFAHQQGGAEAELLSAQHTADGNIAAGEQLGVALNADAAAQAVQDQGLVGLGDAQLPGQARVLDGGAGGCTGAAVVTGDKDDLRAALGNTGGNGADTGLADQLHVDVGVAVGVLQVIDQLSQILDGVDVVVGRGRDQAHAGGAVAGLGDPGVDLGTGQVAALAGLCALCQLDLDLFGGDQILAGHTKAGRGYLLDLGVALALVALLGLTALAGVAPAAQTIQGDGDGLVGLAAQGTVAHGSGFEPLDDGADRLHLLKGDAAVGVIAEVQQAAQVHALGTHVVHGAGEVFEGLVVAREAGFLEQMDGLRGEEVLFLAAAELVSTAVGQLHVDIQTQRVKGGVVGSFHIRLNVFQTDTAHTADRTGEVLVDDILGDADRLKDLAALVALDGGDAHLGGDLHDAVQHSLVVVIHGGVVILVQQTLVDELGNGVVGQIGVDGAGTVAQQGGKVVHLVGLGTLKDEGHGRALLGADEVLGHGRNGQQAGDGNMVLVNVAVREDDDVGTVLVGAVHLQEDAVDGLFQAGVLIVIDGHRGGLEAGHVHVLDLEQIGAGQDGVLHLEHLAVLGLVLQQVAVGTHIDAGGGDHLLTDGIDGRVGDLCEPLLEVVEQRGVLVAQDSQRGVGAHGSGRLGTGPGHGQDQLLDFLVFVAKDLLQAGQLLAGVAGDLDVGDLQVLQPDQIPVDPLAVGLAAGVVFLQLLVIHDLALDGIHQQHFAGAQAVFHQNVVRGAGQHAHLRGQDHPAVLGDIVAAGAQTVAVQHRAHHVAVGEEDGGGAVPGLQHGGVILVEIALFLADVLVVLPGLGDGDHHRQGQVHAVHHHELQRVVQHGGVRAGGVDDGQDLVHVVLQDGALDALLTGQHGIGVALDGVDLAVVQDEAVGVCAHPAGVGVGGEAAVHHADGGLVVGVLQVGVEQAQIVHQEHALVDDGAAGQAGHIGAVAGLLEHPADDVEPAVKINALAHTGRLFDEALPDGGHTVPGLLAHGIGVYRHPAPCQKLKPLLAGNQLKQLHGLCPQVLVLGEEEHADTVFPLVAQADVQLVGHLGEELVADLQHDAHAVAGLALGILTGAVLQTLHDAQGIADRLMALAALDVHHSADAAGIVLELRVIQAKRRGVFRKLIHCLSHPYLSKYPLGRGTIRSLLHRKQKSAPEG